MNTENETFLNDIWSLYFHDPSDMDWNYKSYKRLCDISTVEAYWQTHHLIKDKLHNGMFFLMREHIFPCWDDEYNKNGGCLSIKVLKQDVKTFWEYFTIRMLGECLCKDSSNWDLLNGISTSPKKHFCIVKIWLKTNDLTTKDVFNFPETYDGEILYKPNIDSIGK
jgi:hypothetical protein